MRPMTRLILGTAALAVIFAAVAFGLPSHVTVARSVVVNAPEFLRFFPISTISTNSKNGRPGARATRNWR